MAEELDAAKQWEEAEEIKVRLECGEAVSGIENSLVVMSFSDTPMGKIMSRIWDTMSGEDRKAMGLTDIRLGKHCTVMLKPGVSLSIVLTDGTVRNVVSSVTDDHIKAVVAEDIRELRGDIWQALKVC